MKRLSYLAAVLACSILLGTTIHAQTVATDPVGFVQPFATSPNMLANSDTLVSIPFTRPPEFVGATTAATTNTLTVSGTPWTASQFVYGNAASTNPHNTYFVLIGPHSSTNPKQGRFFTITGNSTNQLTLNVGSEDLSGVAASTQILVIPYNTFNTVFPASDAGVSYIISPNSALRRTQVFIPDYSGNGINLAAAFTYYYFNSAWRRTDLANTQDVGDDVITHGGYFTLRNSTSGTTLTTLGSVLTKMNTIPLITRTDKAQDNFVSLTRPIDVKLDDLGLITSGAFVASTSPALRKDQIFVYDPTQTAINKAASSTYFYFNDGTGLAWRKVGDSVDGMGHLPNRGTDIIPAGSGFIIRKALTATGATAFWQNSPTY